MLALIRGSSNRKVMLAWEKVSPLFHAFDLQAENSSNSVRPVHQGALLVSCQVQLGVNRLVCRIVSPNLTPTLPGHQASSKILKHSLCSSVPMRKGKASVGFPGNS